MSRRVRPCMVIVIAIALLTGCAAPTQLSFDVGESANPEPSMLGGNVTAAPIDRASIDPAPSPPSNDADDNTFNAVEIEERFASLIAAWARCFHRPGACDVSLSTAPESPERMRLADALAYYATEQLRTKPNEGRLEWRIESISTSSEDRVRLITCEYDTRIFFDSSMSDTELGDIILDATVWTRRVEWVLAKSNDTWRLWSRRIERRSPAEKFCKV